MDGLVYGAMIGLGFQVIENVQYFMLAASQSDGQAGAVVGMFFLRVVLSGLYSHMLFTRRHGLRFRLLRDAAEPGLGEAGGSAGSFGRSGVGRPLRLELALAGVALGPGRRRLRGLAHPQRGAIPGTARAHGGVRAAAGEPRLRAG